MNQFNIIINCCKGGVIFFFFYLLKYFVICLSFVVVGYLLLIFFFLWFSVFVFLVQLNFNDNGLLYWIEYGDGGVLYYNYKIFDDVVGELYFMFNGGDGGCRVVFDFCKRRGGEVVIVRMFFSIGFNVN